MLKQITKIEDFRIFRDYSSSANLKDFKKFNVIYGWNGSGKTTLSTFFRLLEGIKCVDDCGDFSIQTDSGEFNEKNITSSKLTIRVFNQDFIKENVFTSTNEVNPIFFLGTEDISKQQEIENLKIIFLQLREKKSRLVPELEKKERNFDKVCKDEAKRIKDYLRSNRENQYSYYDKTQYKQKCNSLKDDDYKIKILDDENLLNLKNTIESPLLDPISKLSLPITKLVDLKFKVETKLNETVVSALIPHLEKDNELNSWVGKGLDILKLRDSNKCPFCEQSITPEFVRKLEGHFNDQYQQTHR